MKDRVLRKQPERSWLEICCFGYSCLQHFWPKAILRKWLNIPATDRADSDFSADPDDCDNDLDSDNEDDGAWVQESSFRKPDDEDHHTHYDLFSKTLPRSRRRKSETLRALYINTKELRISVGTWNVGGKLPPDDLDIREWLKVDEPADIYVLGFQEIVPLNAGNVLGAEDSRPVKKWEYIIRDTLNTVRPPKAKIKCYSDPSSPSRFKPFDVIPDIEDELINTDSDADEEVHTLDDTDSDGDEEVHPLDEEYNQFYEVKDGPAEGVIESISTRVSDLSDNADLNTWKGQNFQGQSSFSKRFENSNCQTEDSILKAEASVKQSKRKLTKAVSGRERSILSWPEQPLVLLAQRGNLTQGLSGAERISLSWPEQPLDLLGQRVLDKPISLRSLKSFKASKSFRNYDSFKSCIDEDKENAEDLALLAELDLQSIINRKRRSPFVRIVSKQMVGVFLSIWVRRSLRRHIQNVKVSTVGVGVMGYIGNKGSVSVSMSIYQTPFCFICTHLTSGEKSGDELRRNTDVKEIHRRTQFHPESNNALPKTIHDHERIIWFGDLNYRINLPYEQTRELVSRREWSKLAAKDQLIREMRKGRAFEGWKEGVLNFPPTYKYDFNSERYCGDDGKPGRRNPAWCDRILSYGHGLRLLKYRRVEMMLSDHRPVNAIYMAEVEVFSHKKLQKALAFTDAELEANLALALRDAALQADYSETLD